MTGVEDVAKVEFDQHRWYLRILLTRADGTVEEYVATADNGITYGDGIWFGTSDEYKEAEARS